MKLLQLSFFLLSFYSICFSQSSLVERLGYTADTKLLIIHADDLGVAHSENLASFHALTDGSVNSASIMPPCPWVAEVADWAKTHTNSDLGIHLTLTNEWKYYRWGPVAPKGDVPGLLNDMGFLHASCEEVVANATPQEVATELRAQIEQILKFGINPTHLDSHMGCLFRSPEYFEIYLSMGRTYDIPVLVPNNPIMLAPTHPMGKLITPDDLIIDHLITANPSNFNDGMEAYYSQTISELQPGVSVILIHCAYDNQEMQGVAVDHPDWGAEWRQADVDFFSSSACQQQLQNNNIQLITWKELGQKWKNRSH